MDAPYTKTNKTQMYFIYNNLIPGATYDFTLMTDKDSAKLSETVRITMGKHT